jgi:Adenylate and Guanylate cyclase catalytic domain
MTIAAACVHDIWTASAPSISSFGAAASIIARAALIALVVAGKSARGRLCSRLRIGLKVSACPSTRGVLLRMELQLRRSPHLTDQDFKDMGVLLGHRRVMLAGIARLTAARPSAPEPTAASAERRQVTVMFSDLVGSTALSARMDPEDLREVISSYQKCVSETVRRFGGFVAMSIGFQKLHAE